MAALIRYAKGAYFWAMALVMTIVFFSGCFLAEMLVRLTGRPHDGRLIHPVASAWGRAIFRLTPGWQVFVEGEEHLPPDGKPVVVVANHESLTDIFVICFLRMQFRWLSKQEVFKIPLVGRAMGWARYVPIRRGEAESHTIAMRDSADRIRQGLSMLFFPEGTRSADGVVKAFKSGAFRLARDLQVPVLPVVLKGTRDLMPKHGRIPQRAVVRIKILPPLPPPASNESLDAYIADVRERIVRVHTNS